MSASLPRPGQPPASEAEMGWMDRLAQRALPPLHALGGPGTIVSPLILVGLLSLGTAALVQPLLPRADPGSALVVWLWVFTAASPLLALGKGLALAAVGWAVLVLLAAELPFRAALSAVLYGELVMALQGPALALLAVTHGSMPSQLGALDGPGEWFSGGSAVLEALANGLSPFHLAWWFFLAAAFTRLVGGSPWRGAATATVLWVLVVGASAVRVLVS